MSIIVIAALGAFAIAAAALRLAHRGLTAVRVDLSDVEVRTAYGEAVRLGSLVDRPTILVLPRYYG